MKISLPKNEITVNLKSASFVVIMLLHEGLTHIQSQIKPRLLSGESFTLMGQAQEQRVQTQAEQRCCSNEHNYKYKLYIVPLFILFFFTNLNIPWHPIKNNNCCHFYNFFNFSFNTFPKPLNYWAIPEGLCVILYISTRLKHTKTWREVYWYIRFLIFFQSNSFHNSLWITL